MRKLILPALLILGMPAVGAATPCVTDSLAQYILLGSSGCTIGDALFSDFSSVAAPGAAEISAIAISVSPLDLPFNPGVGFGLSTSAGAGEIFGNGIGYRVSGISFIARSLSLEGSAVVPDGALTALQFGPGPPLVVFDIGDDAPELSANTSFPLVSFFDVFTEITIDGGTFGGATLDGRVVDRFSAVPEPSTLLLLGSGLVGLAARRRGKLIRQTGGR